MIHRNKSKSKHKVLESKWTKILLSSYILSLPLKMIKSKLYTKSAENVDAMGKQTKLKLSRSCNLQLVWFCGLWLLTVVLRKNIISAGTESQMLKIVSWIENRKISAYIRKE